MKILKLKNSLLFLRINPKKDEVSCFFLFFISWNCFKIHAYTFDLDKFSMYMVKEFYNQLADDWNRKYRF